MKLSTDFMLQTPYAGRTGLVTAALPLYRHVAFSKEW
jgi:hypothetical protein